MIKMVPDKFLNGRICSIMSKKDTYICVKDRVFIWDEFWKKYDTMELRWILRNLRRKTSLTPLKIPLGQGKIIS